MRISFLSRITFSLILVIIMICFLFTNFHQVGTNIYHSLAVIQSKKVVNKIVNQVVLDQVSQGQIEISYSKDEFVSYNTTEINALISSLSYQIVDILEDINHSDYSSLIDQDLYEKYNCSGIVFELEYNSLFNNIFFSSLGGKIPVKFKIASDVLASSEMQVEEFGINNALVSLNLSLSFDFSLILPFSMRLETIDLSIPLSAILIEGEVPSYMLGKHNVEGVNSYLIEVKKI